MRIFQSFENTIILPQASTRAVSVLGKDEQETIKKKIVIIGTIFK